MMGYIEIGRGIDPNDPRIEKILETAQKIDLSRIPGWVIPRKTSLIKFIVQAGEKSDSLDCLIAPGTIKNNEFKANGYPIQIPYEKLSDFVPSQENYRA